MSSAVRFAPVRWPADAEKLGFVSGVRGQQIRNSSVLRSDGSWLALMLRQPFSEDLSRHLLGAPGLWRGLRERRLRAEPRWTRLFDLPPLVSPEAPEGVSAEHPCAALVRWAEATLDGSVPGGWAPPPRAEVEEWLEPARRTVRAGPDVAQIELVVDPTRFALVIPALVRIPPELPPARTAWLEEICCDAQKRWRMARFGVDEAAGSVRAEIDLTGAPTDRVRPLAELALAALACSAQWALPALSVVTDPVSSSEALDQEPRWASPRLTQGGRNR